MEVLDLQSQFKPQGVSVSKAKVSLAQQKWTEAQQRSDRNETCRCSLKCPSSKIPNHSGSIGVAIIKK